MSNGDTPNISLGLIGIVIVVIVLTLSILNIFSPMPKASNQSISTSCNQSFIDNLIDKQKNITTYYEKQISELNKTFNATLIMMQGQAMHDCQDYLNRSEVGYSKGWLAGYQAAKLKIQFDAVTCVDRNNMTYNNIDGTYWNSDNYYCVYAINRNAVKVQETDSAMYCHYLINQDYERFCSNN